MVWTHSQRTLITWLGITLGTATTGGRWVGASEPPTPPSPRSWRDQPAKMVVVTPPGPFHAVEPSVAIDPTHPERIVVASLRLATARHGDGPYSVAGLSESSDGGLTWDDQSVPNPDRRNQGDDVVLIGPDGVAWHGFIGFEGIRQTRPRRARNGVFLQRGHLQGDLPTRVWSEPIPVIDHINTVEPFEDKPGFALGPPHREGEPPTIHVAWSRFDVYGSDRPEHRTRLVYSVSHDGGRTFTPPLTITDPDGFGDARDSDQTVMGATLEVAEDGAVFVAWARDGAIWFDRREPGVRNFGNDQRAAEAPGGWDLPLKGLAVHNGLPTLKLDASSGPHRGRLYLAWLDDHRGNGRPDARLCWSDDRGATWTAPRVIHPTPEGTDPASIPSRVFVSLAVDPTDGAVIVAHLERQGDGPGDLVAVLAYSDDGGNSFRRRVLSEVPPFQPAPGLFLGDYLGLDARDGRVVFVFPRPDPDHNGNLRLNAVLIPAPPTPDPQS